MKKLLKLMLAILLVVSLVGCSGENSPTTSDEEKIKIGVATIQTGESLQATTNYFNNELAPALNAEFLSSESLTNDAAALADFIDKCYAAGCKGVISMVTDNSSVAQAAQKCQEYGMFFVTNNSRVNEDVSSLSYNLGHVGADPVKMGDAYKQALTSVVDDGKEHSVFMFSGAAVGGVAQSHYYSTLGMLQAMEEIYGLTYEKSYDEMINEQNPGEVKHDKENIHIYLCPGYNREGEQTAIAQSQLQTGKYDIFVAVFNYAAFTNAIEECEKSTGVDVKILGTMNVEDQTRLGFENVDTFGNPVVSAAIINSLNPANGILAAMIYNGINGAGEQMKEQGQAQLLGVVPWVITNADEYNLIADKDKEVGKFILSGEEVLKLTVKENPSVTYKDLSDKLEYLSDIKNVK